MDVSWARSLIPRYHQHFTQVWAPTKLLFQQGLNKLAGTGIVGSLGWGCEGGGSNLLTSKRPYIDPFVIPHRGKAESTAMDSALDEFCCDKRDGFASTKKYIYTFMKSALEVFFQFVTFTVTCWLRNPCVRLVWNWLQKSREVLVEARTGEWLKNYEQCFSLTT